MGLDRCRETRGTGTREAARKLRQDFSIQKVKFFLLVAEYEVTSREKGGPLFAPLKMRDVALLLEKRKEKIIF